MTDWWRQFPIFEGLIISVVLTGGWVYTWAGPWWRKVLPYPIALAGVVLAGWLVLVVIALVAAGEPGYCTFLWGCA